MRQFDGKAIRHRFDTKIRKPSRPRKADDIETLMKCAFGAEYDGRSRLGGLRAAANALNDGDLTLAMIAPVKMCLPDLADEAAAERVASADRMLKGGYDPKQPRVPAGNPAGGEWAGPGAGGSSNGAGNGENEPSARPAQVADASTDARGTSTVARIPGLPVSVSPVPNPQIRSKDGYGNGAFGVSRDGDTRKHGGIDLVAEPGTEAVTPASGQIILFDPYRGIPGKEGIYTGVQIATDDGYVVRVHYVDAQAAGLKTGDRVEMGQPIGRVQDLSIVYPPIDRGSITNHVHLDMQRGSTYQKQEPGKPSRNLDPTPLVRGWRTP